MQSFINPKEYISDFELTKFSLTIHKEGNEGILKFKKDDVLIRKEEPENSDRYYDFKSIKEDETELDLQIRQFKANCYRLILGTRQPRVKILYTESGKAIGLLTEFYPGYFTFRELVNEKRKITKKLLIKTN